jgi:hypothetical protein
MTAILSATISETGKKISLGTLDFFNYTQTIHFLTGLYDKVASLLSVNPRVLLIALDDKLFNSTSGESSEDIVRFHPTGVKMSYLNDTTVKLYRNSIIYREDGSLKNITIFKRYVATIYQDLYIKGPESSMRQIAVYDNYNLTTKLSFPPLETIFGNTDVELSKKLIKIVLQIIIGSSWRFLRNSPTSHLYRFIDSSTKTILFNGENKDFYEVIDMLVKLFITFFNYQNGKPITLETLPSFNCNVYGDMSPFSLIYLFSINPKLAYFICQKVSDANFYNLSEQGILIDPSIDTMVKYKIEDIGIIYTLFRGTIWPYRKTISRRVMRETDININPMRHFSNNAKPNYLLEEYNSARTDYKDEDIKLTVGPSLAEPVIRSSLLQEVNHFPTGFNAAKIYNRIKTIFPDLFTTEMLKLQGIVFAGGAPSICASDYLWDLYQRKEITTDIDLFIIGATTSVREKSKNGLLEFLATKNVLVEGVLIKPKFGFFESVIKVEWLYEGKHSCPPVQIICTDVTLPMEVLYNFDMTHIQIGIFLSGSNIYSGFNNENKLELYCSPEYLYYAPRGETLLLRNSIRLHRLIKAMKRGFIPVMRMPYTKLLPSYDENIPFFYRKKYYLEIGKRVTIELEDDYCLLDGRKVLAQPPDTFHFHKPLFQVANKVKLDGRFRNAFDGYIGKSKPTFVLEQKYLTMLETLSSLYADFSEKKVIVKQLSNYLDRNYDLKLKSTRGYSLRNVIFQDLTVDDRKMLSLYDNLDDPSYKMMEFTLPIHLKVEGKRSGYKYYFAPSHYLNKTTPTRDDRMAFNINKIMDIWDTINLTLLEESKIRRFSDNTSLLLFRFRMLSYLPDITYLHLDQSDSPIMDPKLDPNFVYEAVGNLKEIGRLPFWKIHQVIQYTPAILSSYTNFEPANLEYPLTPQMAEDLANKETQFTITDRNKWITTSNKIATVQTVEDSSSNEEIVPIRRRDRSP